MMFDFGWYLFTARPSLKPRLLRHSPYWVVAWVGLGLTNLNVPLYRRMVEAMRAAGKGIYE